MEEVTGPHIFSHWNAVKYMFLRHIKYHLTVLGTVCAIFAQAEYQGDTGNLCHNHFICAMDKSTINLQSETYL